VNQARALDIKSLMVGPLLTQGLIKLGGKAAEGFVGSGIAVDPSTKDPVAKAFLDAYKAKYNVSLSGMRHTVRSREVSCRADP